MVDYNRPMQIILTHEQGDFDAAASLLGAALLVDGATPVLPRRMNRNVRAFVSLYGAELPFIDARELPNAPIDKVILVDTQSMASVRGVGEATPVEVIDHHPARENTPAHWKVNLVDVGATTTVLVEALQERGEVIHPLHATLLLLGIYEDTGSLTYSRTTPRDLRAAAVLVEQGANLGIVSQYLNHPLSPAQQALYERLRASAEHMRVNGHTIVLATGAALEVEEELSSIAHNLRDLIDPDALFVLAATHGGVQMIARSTTNAVDVADVAARFGGGGHERAAAALVRDQSLDSVRQALIDLLPEVVRPAVTVAELMSLRPQVLTPTTTVETAYQSMRRYGYEGYPVVENGRVVGLVTRRQVDRSLSHGRKDLVRTVMNVGSHTVTPSDPIQTVQRLVAETDWGQIPVVDPNSGQVIGIVTRTDLLKYLTPDAKRHTQANLAARLESALPADRLALLRAIAGAAAEQHCPLFIVGGLVRDLLLERPSLDLDLVVEGDAIALARSLAERYGGRVTGHSRFGTAKWRLDDKVAPAALLVEGLPEIDLVSARTEFYTHPTALPTIERGSIKLDLHRRDFTINTLALRLDGRHYGDLYDHWGGLNDLRAGLVRVLHSLSFVDDPTRILRAVRFEQRFAFRIEERTMQLLLEARPMIERLSGDRIRHELNHILVSRFAPQIFSRLHNLGLLSYIHPALVWDDWLSVRIEQLAGIQAGPEWGLAQDGDALKQALGYVLLGLNLTLEEAEGVARRLKLPQEVALALADACRLWQARSQLEAASPSQATWRLEEAAPLARYAVYFASSNQTLRHVLLSYVNEWRLIQPHTNGGALKELGLPPGPLYRRLLDALRRAWLDGQIHTVEEEQVLLKELIAGG